MTRGFAAAPLTALAIRRDWKSETGKPFPPGHSISGFLSCLICAWGAVDPPGQILLSRLVGLRPYQNGAAYLWESRRVCNRNKHPRAGGCGPRAPPGYNVVVMRLHLLCRQFHPHVPCDGAPLLSPAGAPLSCRAVGCNGPSCVRGSGGLCLPGAQTAFQLSFHSQALPSSPRLPLSCRRMKRNGRSGKIAGQAAHGKKGLPTPIPLAALRHEIVTYEANALQAKQGGY